VIVYQEIKSRFVEDALERDIEEVIQSAYKARTGRSVGSAELRSWKESLVYMGRVLKDDGIPDDAGVAIEYHLPQMSKRIDFVLTGRGHDKAANVVIVELKQWSAAELTDKDAVVSTWIGGSRREVSHPSYQAWSYAALLEGFNEAVYEGAMTLQPCAYLHNYERDEVIASDFYRPYVERAPLFLKGEAERNKLREFIKQHVRYGDNADLIYKIENGRIRPSKMLADSLLGMLKGNPEFVLVDEQKVVFETAMGLAERASAGRKKVVIIEGGPGTGKSVLAINLLSRLTRLAQNCRYVSKNRAPRNVYEAKLRGNFRKSEISNFFSGSGSFLNTEAEAFDTLIVDEAHRLNEKSGLYENLGENQIKELIEAAKCSIFFIDEDQRVTLKDIGSKQEIVKWAESFGAEVTSLELASQFRCNGSDGYLAWLDNTLGIRETANESLRTAEFDFRVLDSPTALHALIEEKNKASNRARVVAGYCWDWESKADSTAFDVVIPAYAYAKRWNLTKDGSLWIVAPQSVQEVGCIHTCQGLEVDYIGVIVGDDFIVRNGEVRCRPEYRSRGDRTIRGFQSLIARNPVEGQTRLDLIIKNTYRTLMTRGMKGCYIFCTDPETAEYFRSRLQRGVAEPQATVAKPPRLRPVVLAAPGNVLPFRRLAKTDVEPFINAANTRISIGKRSSGWNCLRTSRRSPVDLSPKSSANP
jgi:DUF2075 family protein